MRTREENMHEAMPPRADLEFELNPQTVDGDSAAFCYPSFARWDSMRRLDARTGGSESVRRGSALDFQCQHTFSIARNNTLSFDDNDSNCKQC